MTDPSTLEQLHRDWNAFKTRYAKPAALIAEHYAPAALETATRTLDTPAAVRAAIAEFTAEQGWLTLTDRHVMISELPAEGIILNGELCRGSESLHIRHLGGRWLLAHYREITGVAATHLACERRFSARTGEQTMLVYRIYYQHTPERGTQPAVARFTGFMEA